MYSDFAQVYDLLMRDVDYPAWAAFYTQLLDFCGVARGGRLAECACGTGNLSIPLARTYRLTGLDISPQMLSQAARKARTAGLDIPFICQDMRQLALHHAQDAVVAGCDGVNYLLSAQDAEQFFAAVWRTLAPGGALVFDVSSHYKLSRLLGNATLTHSGEDAAYIWRNSYEAADCIVRMELDIFSRRTGGSYDRILECQSQRAWQAEELTALLQQAGFTNIAVFGERALRAPTAKEKRLHLAGIKPRED